jgi:hypothetical protein
VIVQGQCDPHPRSIFVEFSVLRTESRALHVLVNTIALSCTPALGVFLRQGLIMQFRLVFNSLCSPGWPQTHTPPASASQVLELQACITMPGFSSSLYEHICLCFNGSVYVGHVVFIVGLTVTFAALLEEVHVSVLLLEFCLDMIMCCVLVANFCYDLLFLLSESSLRESELLPIP